MILEWSSDPEKGAQLHADSLKKEKTKIWQSHLWTRMRKNWSSPGLLMRGGQFHSFWRLAVPSTPDCVHISCDPRTAAPGHTPKEMQTNVSWTQTQETGVGFIPGSGKSPGVESGTTPKKGHTPPWEGPWDGTPPHTPSRKGHTPPREGPWDP